jgi:uncharacterized protein
MYNQKDIQKTLAVFHKDLDGYISALSYAIIIYNIKNKKINLEEINKDIYIPNIEELNKYFDFFYVDYNNENLLQKLERLNYNLNNYSNFVLLDFSCEIEIMKFLLSKFKDKFIWIDHHKRIYEKYEKDIDVNGLRDLNNSACVLVWKYFNIKPPIIAKYIEDMDLWNWKLENSKEILHTLEIKFNNLYNIDNNYFLELFKDNRFLCRQSELINLGTMIKLKINSLVTKDIISGKKIDFHNLNTYIVNSSIKPGEISENIFSNNKYNNIELVLVWYRSYKLNINKVSIRSRKDSNIDCSKIAEYYGGNGHKNAAGFIIENIDNIF